MNTLPYEILQLVASSLLPRYQCRLAMASKWCYRYLYNDLLKWHAQKNIIPVIKHYSDKNYPHATLFRFNNHIVFYEQTYNNGLYIRNLTLREVRSIDSNIREGLDAYMYYKMHYYQLTRLYIKASRILSEFYGNPHYLTSLPEKILIDIIDYLDDVEMHILLCLVFIHTYI